MLIVSRLPLFSNILLLFSFAAIDVISLLIYQAKFYVQMRIDAGLNIRSGITAICQL